MNKPKPGFTLSSLPGAPTEQIISILGAEYVACTTDQAKALKAAVDAYVTPDHITITKEPDPNNPDFEVVTSETDLLPQMCHCELITKVLNGTANDFEIKGMALLLLKNRITEQFEKFNDLFAPLTGLTNNNPLAALLARLASDLPKPNDPEKPEKTIGFHTKPVNKIPC